MTRLTQYQVASGMVQAAYAGVDNTGALAIGRTGVVVGEIAWDLCCGGQLVITEMRRHASNNFPLEQINHSTDCNEPWLVSRFQLSLIRCAPVPDESGQPPSITLLDAAAQQVSKDMTNMRASVMCYLSSMYDTQQVDAFELQSQEIVGPNGACVGTHMEILVGYTNNCGC